MLTMSTSREAILREAGKRLEKQGIGKLSIRDAARRAGLSHNAPYRHFPDREKLLAALASEGFQMLDESLKNKSGRDMGEAYVTFALTHPQRFRLMFGGVLRLDDHPELRGSARASYAALEKAFAGQGVDEKLAAAAAWSLVHGLSHLLLDGHFPGRGAGFVKHVIGAVRFAAYSPGQRSA
jgi:AcrR family transcriptional regulator